MSAQKPVIGLDLDECLGQFVHNLAIFYNKHHGTHLTVDDFHSYSFWEVWGGTKETAAEVIDAFFKDPLFVDGIPLVDGSVEALKILSEKFDIYIVTSRHLCIEEVTRKWIDTHFHGLIKDIYIGNLWNANGRKITKKDMCLKIGASVLIDDNWNYCHECLGTVKVPILFGVYGWNRRKETSDYEGIHCCTTWKEVVDLLMHYDFSQSCVCQRNIEYDSENGESTRALSLESILSHGESTFLLLLAESLLRSLQINHGKYPYLFLGESTAHSTGLLHAEISGNVLGCSKVFLQLPIRKSIQ